MQIFYFDQCAQTDRQTDKQLLFLKDSIEADILLYVWSMCIKCFLMVIFFTTLTAIMFLLF